MIEEIFKVYKETYNKRWGFVRWEVSNYGNVKKNGEPYECNLTEHYKAVAGGYLHRIVAELFIPNPENKPEVDHIDTNPLNNHVDNLRWVTPKENCGNPLTRQHRINHKAFSKPVLQFTKGGKIVAEYPSTQEAHRQNPKVAQSNISACCRGEHKSAGGYIWKYKDDL